MAAASGEFTPLYHQLKMALRGRIERGDWLPGHRIPTERELCEEHGVSRLTVRRAIAELATEGLLVGRQGKGVFVAQSKLEQTLSAFYSFTSYMKEKGLSPTSDILGVCEMPSPPAVAQRLGIPSGEAVARITRLRRADSEPIIYESSYLPCTVFPGLAGDGLAESPLYEILRNRYACVPVRATEWFEPTLLSNEEASLLGVDAGAPAMLLERVTYTYGDRPIEFCKGVVRGDRCRYCVELK
ncbi:MAG: GntR family transcriptional regulator [Clostridia bacterium]|nr:GntR family transcriptional regulator [Clostridia bacterium]